MKKLKFLFSKKGVISLYGVVVALIVCIMLCGYMDLTQTTHVVEEIQSIMDITALSTLQGSLDAEGVRFDRLTLREYTYFLPDDTGISQAERLAINAETDDAELLEALKADSEQLQAVTIWIDGTNADNVNDIAVERIILKNFDYYLTKLLHTGSGASKQPLFDFAHGGLDNLLDYNGNSIIKKYEIREFDAGLVYSSWGVDAENSEGYQKVPQAYLASTIVLYLSVEPTFSSMNLNVEESHVYNALNSANSSSMLHVEGYTDDGLLAVSIRTLSRMTVQGFIASDDTADVGDLGANLDALPYTPEEYFDITDDGIVTGFSEEYYALPQAERPTTIKMPKTIRGITPIAIGDNAFDETENDDNIELMALPDSIKTIGKEAFKNAEYMKTFGFVGASKLDTIKESAFNGCKALLTFSCPSGLTEIPPFAFYGCTSLTTFNFNNGLTKIGISAFENCSRLRGELNLSNTITMIDSKAFFNCSSITKINVPEKLSGLGSAAFGRLSSLALIEKHANNTNFEAIDNVLFQKEGDGTYALVVYPAQRKNTIYTIPLVQGQLVTRIADYAFYGNKYLDTLTYDSGNSAESPEMLHGVKVVGESAFERCVELKTLQFAGDLVNEGGALVREGLQVVGANAFYNTPAMSLIYIDKLKDSVAGSPWGANTFITTIRWKADDSFDWSKIYLYNQAGVILSLSDYGAEVVKSDPNFELVIPSTINDPYWGEIAITAIGNNAFSTNPEHSRYADANSKISKQPEFIANVTSIGSYAFEGTMIENFTLPDSVTSVGDGAFAKSALVNFIINESAADTVVFGNYVFDGCANLAEFVIPYRVAEVGIGMFKDCISMQKVVIDTMWTKLPDYTFSGCGKLNSIEAPHTIIEIGDYCFADCATLRGIGLTRQLQIVGKYAFTGCNTLEVVNFGDTITTIKENAFFKTPVLATVYLDVEEDFVPGQPWGAESFTDIIWRNSKWAKYYIYEAAPNGTWKIVGLSELGRKVLTDKSLTAFETPAYYEGAEIVGFSMTKAEDKTALKNLTKMKIVAVKHNQGYPIADSSFEGCTSLRAFEMSSTITSIGAKVFKDCNVLTKISIPASVTSLGAYAFQNCSSLQQVTLGVGVTDIKEYTFQNCVNLQTLGILGDFTNVGTYAFQNCKSLPTFHIKDSCATIGDYAFENCSTLLTVTCDGNPSITTFNTGLFKNSGLKTIQMPKSLKTINSQAFYDCSSLTTIKNADTCALTTINEEAFMNTTSLSELPSFPQLQTIGVKSFYNTGAVTIQSQPALTVINSNAFQNSLKLKTFKSCNSLYTIGSYAFKGCTALQTIQAHSSLNLINTEAFYNCTGLVTFADQPSLQTIESKAFYNTTKLSDFTQNSVKTVGVQAFRNSGIQYFHSNSVTTVEGAAFNSCTKLTQIVCTSNINFGEGSFAGCTALTTVNASKAVTIDDMAFDGCTSLSEVVRSDSLTRIGSSVFRGSVFRGYHVGSAIKIIDAHAFTGSQITTLHMHVGEYKSRTISNHSNSTTTITNSRANEPWGADGAYVRWYNTLIVNGVTVSSSTTAVSQKQALTYVAPGQGSYSESITVQYNGDAVNDLTWLKSKAITRGNTLAWSYNNGTIQYNASNNTNGYTDKATLTEAYTGAVVTIQWDMDNALIFDGQDSHVLDVPWAGNANNTVSTYGGTIKYTDSDWSTLSITASAAEIARCYTPTNALVKFESEPAAGGGHSGEVVITFSGEDTNGVTQSTKVIVKHALYFADVKDETKDYGSSLAVYVGYTGDGDTYLTFSGGSDSVANRGGGQRWFNVVKFFDDYTLSATDGYVKTSKRKKLYFQDYFKDTSRKDIDILVFANQQGATKADYQYAGPVGWMTSNMEVVVTDTKGSTTANYNPGTGYLWMYPMGDVNRIVNVRVQRRTGNAGGRKGVMSGIVWLTVTVEDNTGVG